MGWQERLIEERDQLQSRLRKLQAFIKSENFQSVDDYEQLRLSRQKVFMEEYLKILHERIANCETTTSPTGEDGARAFVSVWTETGMSLVNGTGVYLDESDANNARAGAGRQGTKVMPLPLFPGSKRVGEPKRDSNTLVTKDEIDAVWGNADFGDTPRMEIVKQAVLKCNCGFHQGHTSKMIAEELGLIYEDEYRVTKRGKFCLWKWYGDEMAV